jgi:hypothetical protein
MMTRTETQNAIKYAHQNLFICDLKRLHKVNFAGAGSASSASELLEMSDFDIIDATMLMSARIFAFILGRGR